jgi:hypothetical protein
MGTTRISDRNAGRKWVLAASLAALLLPTGSSANVQTGADDYVCAETSMCHFAYYDCTASTLCIDYIAVEWTGGAIVVHCLNNGVKRDYLNFRYSSADNPRQTQIRRNTHADSIAFTVPIAISGDPSAEPSAAMRYTFGVQDCVGKPGPSASCSAWSTQELDLARGANNPTFH